MEIQSWWIIGIIVILLYLWSAYKNRGKTIKAFKKSGGFVLKSIPLFFLAMLLIGFLAIALLPNTEVILAYFGQLDVGIFWAIILGFVLPGPRYAIYPLAELILMAGGSVGAVMTLIASQQLIDVPEGAIIEIKYFGGRYFITRLIIACLTCIIAGYLAAIVHIFFPLYPP